MPESAKAGSSPLYRIFETRQFSKDLACLGSAAANRVEAKLRHYAYPILRQNPHFGPNIKRLKNWDPPTWRYRAGEWRFFYEVDDQKKIVFMIAADHRKQAYRS
jgi:mRNA interferase RelE/StbE